MDNARSIPHYFIRTHASGTTTEVCQAKRSTSLRMLATRVFSHAPLSCFASTSAQTLPLLLHSARHDVPPFFHQHERPSTERWAASGEPLEDSPGAGLPRGPGQNNRKGKGKQPMREGPEEEVDDREWEMRVGACSVSGAGRDETDELTVHC